MTEEKKLSIEASGPTARKERSEQCRGERSRNKDLHIWFGLFKKEVRLIKLTKLKIKFLQV